MLAVECKNLVKRYGEVVALDGVNLEVNEGELFALLGVNGAGKSTLVKILCCLTNATSGDAFVLGHSVASDPQNVKNRVAVSLQETAVARNLTVNENLRFCALLYSADCTENDVRCAQIVTKLGLDGVADKKAKTLSGGYQRRLSIAMALVSQPKVLLLDEPTLGLDVLARRELWNVIRELKNHVTIILTTHYMEEAESLADRIAVLQNGTIREVGTPQQLCERYSSTTVEDAFVKIVTGGAQ